MSAVGGKRRLFFALWPDAALRHVLEARRGQIRECAGRPVPVHNLHLTLSFLGDLPADRLAPVLAAAEAVHGTRFTLWLDHFGVFPRARVLWLGGNAPTSGRRLLASLNTELAGRGLEVDRRPWRPHVTLFQRLVKPPPLPEITPVNWRVADFSLIESRPGQPYQVLRTWSLE